jgi:hypothetical protein
MDIGVWMKHSPHLLRLLGLFAGPQPYKIVVSIAAQHRFLQLPVDGKDLALRGLRPGS